MLLLAAVSLAALLTTASAQLYGCPPSININGTTLRNLRGVEIGKWEQCEYSVTGGGPSAYCFYYTASKGIANFPDTPFPIDSSSSCPTTLPLAGAYLIKSSPGFLSGNCLTIPGTDGGAVRIGVCDYKHWTFRQQWTFDGNTIRQDGQCLDITDGVNADGTLVQTWTCAGNANQNFARSGGQILSSEVRISWLTNPDKCLDLPNGDETAGNQIQIWTCDSNNANQLWYLEPVV